ncbi:RNA polymerase II elongation factor ELL-like isoform X2 [Sardina pilchardus]|uniref:RNA polymerase II elongation factor ELL-like isoform X2 n=1 Tax=Sardina pilchardus TaxID=27697 RepID=UPI002E15DB7D
MATLKEEQSYGLSCGRLSNGSNTSIFHVKLTDSALRAIESYQSSKGSTAHPSIRFTGNQGKISIPRGQTSEDYVTFTFYLSHVGRDNPQGSFDCIQQYATCDGAEELDCRGVIQDKITVNATDDSYQKARQNMAQVEEETRRRGAIVIKQGRYMSKKVQIRKPPAGLTDVVAPSRRVSRPVLISSSGGGGSSSSPRRPGGLLRPPQEKVKVAGLPLRERLTHLLALKPYRKAELILRLQRDGLAPQERDTLDGLLTQVAHLSEKDNTFTLKDGLLKDVRKDWPGYSEGDRQLLKRILITKSRKLGRVQNLRSSPATVEVTRSPQREQASSSPSQKRPQPDYIDPLANKKPRISHLLSRAPAQVNGGLLREREASPVSTTTEPRVPRLELPRPCEPLSDVSSDSAPSGRDGEGSDAVGAVAVSAADRLGPTLAVGTATRPSLPPPPPCQPAAATPTTTLHKSKSRKKSKKHKERERESRRSKDRHGARGRDTETSTEDARSRDPGRGPDVNSTYEHSSGATEMLVPEDYLENYKSIASQEQRQRYKNDFNVEYNEYRALHARIEGVTRQFTVLEGQLKQLQQGSDQYQTIHNQILQEYRKIKKSNPNYSQDKNRCEYLHNKLAYIKKTIAEYDHKQL